MISAFYSSFRSLNCWQDPRITILVFVGTLSQIHFGFRWICIERFGELKYGIWGRVGDIVEKRLVCGPHPALGYENRALRFCFAALSSSKKGFGTVLCRMTSKILFYSILSSTCFLMRLGQLQAPVRLGR